MAFHQRFFSFKKLQTDAACYKLIVNRALQVKRQKTDNLLGFGSDDDGEADDFTLKVRPQFEGKKGAKLMMMQEKRVEFAQMNKCLNAISCLTPKLPSLQSSMLTPKLLVAS